MYKFKLGIIGVGVMGQAILNGVVDKKTLNTSEITLFDVNKDKTALLQNQYHICNDLQELVNNSEFILFAIKPQQFKEISQTFTLNPDQTILTIMAGIKIETIQNNISTATSIVRIMPNMPCRIGEGICALCFKNSNDYQKIFANKIFSSCGKTIEIEEQHFDAVTSVSGSGPAYVFMFLDALIKGGINGGLSYEDSKVLAISTLIGSTLFANSSSDELSTLIDKVCSKGGTTIEAINIFKEKHLSEIIQEGICACKNRSTELSKGI